MKIFSAAQIKKWDAFTIQNEPVASIDLMERAAKACYNWLIEKNLAQNHFKIFCGKGNNGGDGLALAGLLIQNNCRVTVYILDPILCWNQILFWKETIQYLLNDTFTQ